MPRLTPMLAAVLLALVPAISLRAHSQESAIAEMATAAQSWLGSLSPDQRRTAQIAFTSEERENWHYVPKAREGLALGQMTEDQRSKARILLSTGLSDRGLLQAEAVIALERVLRVLEEASHRDELRYHVSVFDTPSASGSWGWRIEGHHLSLNFTVVAGKHIVATPNFMGANPAEVRVAGPQIGKRALAAEEDLARKLVQSFDNAQRARAVFSASAPGDILTRAQRKVQPLDPSGLGYAEMSPAQQARFKELFAVFAGRLRAEVSNEETRKVDKAGWEKLSFAWAGEMEPGRAHYYRIQGPSFVIEYDNTQNGANHIHTVWRSFDGDFGRDLLHQHYRDSHQ